MSIEDDKQSVEQAYPFPDNGTICHSVTEVVSSAHDELVDDPFGQGEYVVCAYPELKETWEEYAALHGTLWEVVETWVDHTATYSPYESHEYVRRYLCVPVHITEPTADDERTFRGPRLTRATEWDDPRFFDTTDEYTSFRKGELQTIDATDHETCPVCGCTHGTYRHNTLSSTGGVRCASCGYDIERFEA